ncbi:MAG TPA: FlgD immunoglobulin-like domain containing protein [Chthonomonadaceae bacterium]|nr:FlgD immunoglobulin-like domain containing protein [Chthonomonadaceae bacterium]
MKRLFCRRMAVFGILILSALAASAAGAQSYHNIVNRRFATVGAGPQSALIIDVKDASDTAAVRQAALQAYQAVLQSRRPALMRELDFMRQHRLVKPNEHLDFSTAVMVRQNGRLPMPAFDRGTRAPGPSGDLKFVFPTSGTGAWDANTVGGLETLTQTLYTELKNILGPPLWSGTVTVLNLDPTLGKVSEPLGAMMIVNEVNGQPNVEIDFPTFSSYETQFLAMAQVMAQAFHGPYRIGYDAWEIGMARAVAVIAARQLQPQITAAGQTVNPANGFYFTPEYDLLNEPPLANNTFLPPNKSNQPFNPATLSGMLVPRLQMSSTAWLKVYIENSSFFQAFNASYYYALATQGLSVANNIPLLVGLAAAIVPTVEMQTFPVWYQNQYVLDTSVTPGPKLYAYPQPTFPDQTTNTPGGVAVFLVYYQTTPTGDEQDLSGTIYPIYWDYTFTNHLTFQSGTSVVAISNGFGTVAPFLQNIGSPDTMRIAMDFPINSEYVRVYFPANETGTESNPNDFSGVVVGADTGTLGVTFEGGGTVTTQVVQGAFGAASSGAVPSGFSKTLLNFSANGQLYKFQRNTAFNDTPPYNVSPIFELIVPGQVVTLSHTFASGPQMVSLPLQPLNPDLAGELGITPDTALLAQWREDTQIQPKNPDQYMRYPSMPLYQPGYSFWSNFPSAVTDNNLLGENMDVQREVSIALNYGWNQIGPPYNASVNVTTDLAFTDQGTLYPDLKTAQNNSIIAQGIFAYSSSSGYVDITSATETGFPQNTMQPWQGYWIRVLVPEGVTLTYSTASSRAAKRGQRGKMTRVASSRPTPPDPDGWRVPLALQDEAGHATSAVLGQSSRGADSFVPSLDEASPPPFSGNATLGIRFPHSDWDAGFGGSGGDFLADIRRANTKSQWDVTVTVPAPNASYTLSWNGTATLPRNTRLTLLDPETGAHQMMNTTSSYTFRSGTALTHHFQIVAEPHLVSHLFIRNVAVLAPLNTGGRAIRSMSISYELTADAEANVEILQAGHVVRHLVTGRAVTAGVNQMPWDLKDDQGRWLASGAYMVSITAHTPDGEQTRQIVPLLLTR